MAYEELVLTNATSTFIADRQLINCGGLGAAGLAGRFWSPDGRYFYYTTAREGMPEGCDQYWSQPFSRVDLRDRSVQYIGIGDLSPDGKLISAWQDGYLLLLPVEAESGTLVALPHPDQQLGALAWSPTSNALAFIRTVPSARRAVHRSSCSVSIAWNPGSCFSPKMDSSAMSVGLAQIDSS